jgi:hypothetical protein
MASSHAVPRTPLGPSDICRHESAISALDLSEGDHSLEHGGCLAWERLPYATCHPH